MSIQSEIERISQAKTDIHSAIESKGVTVPDDTLISEMAPYIQQIREAGTVVTSVNSIGPDGSGNVELTAANVGAATAAQGALAETAVQPAQIADFITEDDIPSELPNPYSLGIQLNGGSTTAYDGSATRNVNITAAAIGAATSSDLEALEPFVGTTSNTTPLQVYNALSGGRQCFITDSSTYVTYTSWSYNGTTSNGNVHGVSIYINSGRIASSSLDGAVSSSGGTWNRGNTSGLLYTGSYRSSNTQFLTATVSDGLVLEEISASSIGAAPIMHSVTDTTYGVGTQSYYGHVRLSDSITDDTSSTSSGYAATPYAVSQVNEKIPITHKVIVPNNWTTSAGGSSDGMEYGVRVSFEGASAGYEISNILLSSQYSWLPPTDNQKTAASQWTYVYIDGGNLHFYAPTQINTSFYLIVTITTI